MVKKSHAIIGGRGHDSGAYSAVLSSLQGTNLITGALGMMVFFAL